MPQHDQIARKTRDNVGATSALQTMQAPVIKSISLPKSVNGNVGQVGLEGQAVSILVIEVNKGEA
jgi:hypothetical protein